MTLKEGQKGETYVVSNIELEQATMVRLKALGLTDGTYIKILNHKKSGAVIFHGKRVRIAHFVVTFGSKNPHDQ